MSRYRVVVGSHAGRQLDRLRDWIADRTIPFRRAVTIGYVIAGADVVIVAFAYRGQDLAHQIERQP